MAQIKSIGVLQSAKFTAVFYFVLTLIFAIPVAIIGGIAAVISGKLQNLSILLIVFAPIVYAIVGFVLAPFPIGCIML